MNLVGNIDLALIALYAFWLFFAGLLFYLRREDRREGYPLEDDRTGAIVDPGIIWIPPAKAYRLPDGTTHLAPRDERDTRDLPAEPVEAWPGAPLEPTGNPMTDAVGPGAYAMRRDIPDADTEGRPRIVPISMLDGYSVVSRDPNPVGMTVHGADGADGGTVTDLWVDRMEVMIRYLQVETPDRRTVLVPMPFARVDRKRGSVEVNAISGGQFEDVPGLKSGDRITRLEEEKVSAYFGAGTLYSDPLRREPLI